MQNRVCPYLYFPWYKLLARVGSNPTSLMVSAAVVAEVFSLVGGFLGSNSEESFLSCPNGYSLAIPHGAASYSIIWLKIPVGRNLLLF